MLSRIHGGHMGMESCKKERACDILFCFLLHLQLTGKAQGKHVRILEIIQLETLCLSDCFCYTKTFV